MSVGEHTWLVGSSGGINQLFYRADDDWQPVRIDPSRSRSLNAVHVFEDGSIVAVGDGGFVATGSGGAWRVLQASGQNLVDVWGAAPDDLWVVTEGSNPELLRFDGLDWTKVDFWSYGVARARPRAVKRYRLKRRVDRWR